MCVLWYDISLKLYKSIRCFFFSLSWWFRLRRRCFPVLAGYKHATIVTFFISFTGGYTIGCWSPHNVWLFNSACRWTAILKSLSSSAERNGGPEKGEDELAVHGLCRETAILRGLSSSADRNGEPEKVEVELAVDGLCQGTAIQKSLPSSADNNDDPGKEEDEYVLAVDVLCLGNLTAYSSSKMGFFGFTNLSLTRNRCDFNSFSSTTAFNKFTSLCLGGSVPFHFFWRNAIYLLGNAQLFSPLTIYLSGLEVAISASIFLANEIPTFLEVLTFLL